MCIRDRRNPAHLPDEELLLFAEGELPLRRTAWARQHLAECGRCRARGEELEATLRDFVRLHETQTDSRESVRRGLRASVSAELSKAAAQKGRWRFGFSRVSLAHQLACACVAIILVAGGAWLLRGFAFQQPVGHLSVSYTHLDVYKRQKLPNARKDTAIGRENYVFFLRNVALLPYTPEQLLAMSQQEWSRSVAFEAYQPVSYTHLDVYKRQP